jgi:hypothetical protein
MTSFRFAAFLSFSIVSQIIFSAVPARADYTATGKFVYEDREFNLNGFTADRPQRPIRFAEVRIMAGDQELAKGATNAAGEFSVNVPGSTAQSITAICVARSGAEQPMMLHVRVAIDEFTPGDYYSVSSSPIQSGGVGIVPVGTTMAASGSDPGGAFNIWDVLVDGLEFVASPQVNGAFPSTELTVIWNRTSSRTGSFFADYGTRKQIYIGSTRAHADTVIAHELAHFVDNVYSKSDSPGGPHTIGDDKQDIRLSWGEGLATFLGSSMRQFKGYARPDLYVSMDGEQLSFSYEIESLTGNVFMSSRTGSTNEVAVTAALWDITDGDASDDADVGDDDPLTTPFSAVWKNLTQHLPTVMTSRISIEDFWIGWFSPGIQNGFLPEMQTVFATLNGIEFIADALEGDNDPRSAPLAGMGQIPLTGAGPRVLITEIDMGSFDKVELYNAGSEEVDLTGWKMIGTAPGFETAIFEIPEFRLAPGAFVVLSEASWTSSNTWLYFGKNISWANEADGACALMDKSEAGMSFVRWGRSAEPAPKGLSIKGPNPASPAGGKNLCRRYDLPDTGTAADWGEQSPSVGTYNFGGAELHHTFYPDGDGDHVAFNATAGTEYIVEVLNAANGASPVIEVLSGDGTVLQADEGAGARIRWTAPSSGRFHVRSRRLIHASNHARFGSYDVRISTREPLTVSPAGTARFRSISEAVAAARPGDIVEIRDSGRYAENLVISGKSLTIRAARGASPVLDGSSGGGLPAAALNAPEVRIEGLRIRGGSPVVQLAGGNAALVNTAIYQSTGPPQSSDGIQVTGPGSSLNLVHCVVTQNGRAGLALTGGGTARVSNTVIAGNSVTDIFADGTSGTLTVRNSLVGTGDFAGRNGNIAGEPRFADPENGDFRLVAGSGAIDKGDAAEPDLPSTDADGILRATDGIGTGRAIPDIGMYEYLRPAALPSVAVFPQIAIGGTYRTSILAVNGGASESTTQVVLNDSTGAPIDAGALGRSGPSTNIGMAPLGSVRLDTRDAPTTITGYAQLRSRLPSGGSALFQMLAGDRIASEAGVGVSKPAANFRIYIDNRNSAISGYAIANPGSSTATISLTLRGQNGSKLDLGDRKTLTIGPGRHLAEFAYERFPNRAPAGFEGSLEFASDQPLHAVALRYDNAAHDVFSAIPVLADEAATNLYFPQVADGGGYRSTFIFVNPTNAPAAATMEFFTSSGKPLRLRIDGSGITSRTVRLSPHGVSSISTDGSAAELSVGWVRVRSNVPIGGSLIFQTRNGGRVVSQAGVGSSPLSARFTSYVESAGFAESGLALCNPSANHATVALRLRNSAGEVVGATSILLPPLGHAARFFTQWFPNSFDEFQGSLEVISSTPVGGVALRYDNVGADVFATIPVVQLQ